MPLLTNSSNNPICSESAHAGHREALPLQNKVAILDCGAQYTKVIDRVVRAMAIESTIYPLNTPACELKDYGAIILSGGPGSVHDDNALPYDATLFDTGIPVLGICYGMQLIAQHFNGIVTPAKTQEYGETDIILETSHPLFTGLANKEAVLMSHGDAVSEMPKDFRILGTSVDGEIAAIAHNTQAIAGLQFHPEVELTPNGKQMIQNFLLNMAGLKQDFSLDNRLEETIVAIQRQVGTRPVLSLVSGGVDSAVTTALLLKALPAEQVYALHIDTGMMRENESQWVIEALKNIGLKHLKHLEASEAFLNATTDLDGTVIGPLNTVTNPEHKRRIIGDTFLKLTQDMIQSLNLNLDETFIAQGTLRPDLIESGNVDVSATAHTIKTHHNDVPLIQEQRKKGLIIETNRDWHKDEVREIGRMCGLPETIVARQPFPGPGLGIRMICLNEPVASQSDSRIAEGVNKLAAAQGLQATLLPFNSVGVQGDARSYRRCAALTGFKGQIQAEFDALYELVRNIPNQCPDINRLILHVGNTPTLPSNAVLETITPTTLTPETLGLLRRVDALVTQRLKEHGCFERFSQTFSILLPVSLSQPNHRSIVIRSVITSDFMTARSARLGPGINSEWPFKLMQDLGAEITQRFPEISDVFVDLTSKPPATVEWE